MSKKVVGQNEFVAQQQQQSSQDQMILEQAADAQFATSLDDKNMEEAAALDPEQLLEEYPQTQQILNRFVRNLRRKVLHVWFELSSSRKNEIEVRLSRATPAQKNDIKEELLELITIDEVPTVEQVEQALDSNTVSPSPEQGSEYEITGKSEIEVAQPGQYDIPEEPLFTTVTPPQEEPASSGPEPPTPISLTCRDAISAPTLVSGFFGPPTDVSAEYSPGALIETILIEPDESFIKKRTFQYQKWKKYLECFVSNNRAEYFRFKYARPISKSRFEGSAHTTPSKVASVDSSYNFYLENYENILELASENHLPNLYIQSLINRESQHKHLPNPRYYDLMSLFGEIDVDPTTAKGQYYDKFARKYLPFKTRKSLGTGEPLTQILNRQYSNLLLPPEELTFLAEVNKDKYLFPMHVDIEFSTDRVSAFSELLKETKMMTPLITEVLSKFLKGQSDLEEPVTETFLDEDSFLKAPGEVKQSSYTKRDVKLKTIDMSRWLNEFLEPKGAIDRVDVFKNLNFNLATPLGEYHLGAAKLKVSDSRYQIHKQILLLAFSSKLKKYIETYRRTFLDIYNGKLAHSETLFYRVTKYLGDKKNKNVVQSLFIPNSTQIDIHRIIDTQVKYDVKYHYEIVAYHLVVGTKVKYRWVRDVGERAAVQLITTPTLKVVELPYYEESTRIVDDPPLAPQMEFISYRDEKNKVLINLNQNVGTHLEEPVLLEAGDAALFDKIRGQQKRKDRKVRFTTDDHATHFEIFRIEKKPTSYEDFTNSLYKKINTDYDVATKQKATSASVKDFIECNRKYYYTARTIDVHGKKSNPSPVFEVELIELDGFIYHSFRMLDISEGTKKRNPEKSFKNTLKIIAADAQVIVNEAKLNGATVDGKRSAILGVKEEGLWGKTFKFRITSKHSGKKLDINVKFVSEFDTGKSLLNEK